MFDSQSVFTNIFFFRALVEQQLVPLRTPQLPKVVEEVPEHLAAALKTPVYNVTAQSMFTVTRDFRVVLAKVAGVGRRQTAFTYAELTRHLSSYILKNAATFFDKRNIRVCLCKGDALSTAFQVDAFHRTQVT
jgi:hypothetical protein